MSDEQGDIKVAGVQTPPPLQPHTLIHSYCNTLVQTVTRTVKLNRDNIM